MSADLDFSQDFPKIRILKSINDLAIRRPSETAEDDDEDGGCRTPTAAEHKIPAILTCPPAPRKRKGPVIPCKRKLAEFEFFDIAHRDEVDEFFRSAIETKKVAKTLCRDLKFEFEI